MNKWQADRKISGMAFRQQKITARMEKAAPGQSAEGSCFHFEDHKQPSTPSCSDSRAVRPDYVRLLIRRRRALAMTDTELKLMAAAAIIGLSSRCAEIGYSTPAAIGTPRAL